MKGKAWGTTETVLATPFCEVHRIEVVSGGHCSWHHHERKVNVFVLLSGALRIETEDASGSAYADLSEVGALVTVGVGVKHRFVNIFTGTARVLELYYPEGLSEDIIRASIGGRS